MAETKALSNQVGHVILVLSGKGGVGKSMVACNLARTLFNTGKKVGLLDVDLCGPSIPRLMGIENQEVRKCPEGWVPIFAGSEGRREDFKVMSIGFLLSNKDDPIIWRGPKKNSMITQLLTEVFWQDLDFLVIDTPPGTSDEIISVVEKLKIEFNSSSSVSPFGGILVTTPQNASLADVRRQFTFCQKTGLQVIGLVENMAFFECPHCSDCTNVFSSGGGESLSQLKNIPLLARVPIVPRIGEALDRGLHVGDEGVKDPILSALIGVLDELDTRWPNQRR